MALTKTDLTRYTDDANTVLVQGMTEPPLGSAAFKSSNTFLVAANNLSDIPSDPAARANLGLKTAATHDVKLTTGTPDYSIGKGSTDQLVAFGNLGDAAFTSVAAILASVPAPAPTPPGFTFTGNGYVVGTGVGLAVSPRIKDIDAYKSGEDYEMFLSQSGSGFGWPNDGNGGALLATVHRITPAAVPSGGQPALVARNYVTSRGRLGGGAGNTRTAAGTVEVLRLDDCRAPSAGHFAINVIANYGEIGDPWFGTSDNIFNVRGDGAVFADGAFTSPAADYAEWFQTVDDVDIEPGYPVHLVGGRVQRMPDNVVYDSHTIIGITRPHDGPAVIGNSAETKWAQQYLRDEFGGFRRDRTGAKQLNPEYDPNRAYVPRSARRGWVVVGLMGQIPMRRGQPIGDRWVKMGEYATGTDLWLVR